MPAISVVMTTFNGMRFLQQQLDSIAAQTRLPDEIVIGDDCSSDATAECVEGFARRHPAIEVHFERNSQRLGSTANFESAVLRTRGEIVFFCDQDDAWYPDRIESSMAAFEADPDCAFVFGNGDLIDEAGHRLGRTLFDSVDFDVAERRRFQSGQALEVLMRRNVVTGATLAVRRGPLLSVLPFEPGWIHDYWIVLMLQLRCASCLIDRPLIQYRLHASQQVGVARSSLQAAMAYARKQGIEYCRAEAQAWRRLQARLGAQARSAALPTVEAKCAFIEARARMRERPAAALPLVAWALIDGRYSRLSLGFKQAVVDLLSSALAWVAQRSGKAVV